MQTFLPYPNFAQSAACLDRQRLGKQRVETVQLLKANLVPGAGWANHPAAKMWKEHEIALFVYGSAVCSEWISRGYRDNCMAAMKDLLPAWFQSVLMDDVIWPSWFGDPTFHASHRSNLLRKDPVHYGQFGWTEGPGLPYVWPVG